MRVKRISLYHKENTTWQMLAFLFALSSSYLIVVYDIIFRSGVNLTDGVFIYHLLKTKYLILEIGQPRRKSFSTYAMRLHGMSLSASSAS